MSSFLLCLLLLLACCRQVSGEPFALVRDGAPACSVRLDAAGQVAELARSELVGYVKRMSGASLGPAPAGRSVSMALDSDLGWDAFRIDAREDGVRLTGGNERGLLYAVYQLLEDLGCRFLALGAEGENVPERATLAVETGVRTFRPALRYRGLIVQQGLSERNLLMVDWMAKNRMNYWVNPCWVFPGRDDGLSRRFVDALERRGILWEFGHHTFAHWITRGEREEAVLGLKDGKRGSHAICISNPRAARKVAEGISAFVGEWPQVDVVSLWANDGTAGWCECEGCTALYGDVPAWRGGGTRLMSRPYFTFVNEVARVLESRPQRRPLCVLAYVNTIELPPGLDLHPDLLVTVAPIGRNYAKPLAELEYFGPVADAWAARLGERGTDVTSGSRLMAYEYYAGVYANNSLPIPTVAELADDVAHYVKTGFGGITTQAEEGHWGTYSLDFYALARMAYHGPQGPKPFVAEFCRDYYGPAAEPMAEYWTFQEDLIRGQERVGPGGDFFRLLRRTGGAIGRLDGLVRKAEERAVGAPFRQRVRFSRLSVDYVKLLRDGIEAGSGAQLDALDPTPKGKGHLGPIASGDLVHLRFPVPETGGLELFLGNVVAMSGAGTSYRLEVRRDNREGGVLHTGKPFTGDAAQAEKHVPGRAWNDDNRQPVDISAALTEADRERGALDVYVTAHTEGDGWTLYRDDNDSRSRDIKARAAPARAREEREESWGRLEAFVKEHAQSGIFNAAPGYVLSRCRKLIAAAR